MSELNLKALRERYERECLIRDKWPEHPAWVFILQQIERVEGCGCCDATGERPGWQDADTGLPVPCLSCGHLRADLLELQKAVLGVSEWG